MLSLTYSCCPFPDKKCLTAPKKLVLISSHNYDNPNLYLKKYFTYDFIELRFIDIVYCLRLYCNIYNTLSSTCFNDNCLWLTLGDAWYGIVDFDCFDGERSYDELLKSLLWIKVDEIVFLALSMIFWYILEFSSSNSLTLSYNYFTYYRLITTYLLKLLTTVSFLPYYISTFFFFSLIKIYS